MKQLFIFLFSLISVGAVYAQNGDGIVFEYDPNGSGYRVARYYDSWASLAKPGKDSTGQQADTVIGYFQEKSALDKNIFVRAYPNPVRDILFVENLSWQEGGSATLKVYDVSGKLIMEKITTQPKEIIQMGALPPGNYHVKYYSNFTYLISWKIAKI